MLGDPRRMRNIEWRNQRWWDRVQAEGAGRADPGAPRAAALRAAEAAAAAAAGPDELMAAVEAMGRGAA